MNRIYFDRLARPVLVLPELDGFASFMVLRNGCLKRVAPATLALRETFGIAQGDLARYARRMQWKRLCKGPANRKLMDIVRGIMNGGTATNESPGTPPSS